MALKSIVGNNILPAVLAIPTTDHCFSIAVDIDLFYGHCSAKIMQHCTTARNIAVAFKGARRVRGIRDSNRAIVPDKVCTGITQSPCVARAFFCNCIPIQIQHNLLAFFDHQSGNAFIPGGHMLFLRHMQPFAPEFGSSHLYSTDLAPLHPDERPFYIGTAYLHHSHSLCEPRICYPVPFFLLPHSYIHCLSRYPPH